MSSAPHPPGHDDHAFTGEPVRVLAADEPRTPGWLPLLGIALFTGAAIIALVGHEPQVAAAASAATPEPAPPPAMTGPPVARPAPPPLGAPGATALPKRTPEQIDKMRKLLEASKAKGGAPPAR